MRIWAALTLGILLCTAAGFPQERPRLRPVPKNDTGMTTGPAVGERIPSFSAPDQNGKRQTFDTLKGEHGLVLMFVRSADW